VTNLRRKSSNLFGQIVKCENLQKSLQEQMESQIALKDMMIQDTPRKITEGTENLKGAKKLLRESYELKKIESIHSRDKQNNDLAEFKNQIKGKHFKTLKKSLEDLRTLLSSDPTKEFNYLSEKIKETAEDT